MSLKNTTNLKTEGAEQAHTDWPELSNSLKALVAAECDSYDHARLTERIVRAVHTVPVAGWSFEDLWAGILVSWFRPVVVMGMLLILFLVAYNAGEDREHTNRTTTELVLGLHPITVASAFDPDLDSIGK